MVAGVRVPAAGARRGGRRRHPGHRRPGDQRSIDRRPGRPPADGPGSDHCSGGGRCFGKRPLLRQGARRSGPGRARPPRLPCTQPRARPAQPPGPRRTPPHLLPAGALRCRGPSCAYGCAPLARTPGGRPAGTVRHRRKERIRGGSTDRRPCVHFWSVSFRPPRFGGSAAPGWQYSESNANWRTKRAVYDMRGESHVFACSSGCTGIDHCAHNGKRRRSLGHGIRHGMGIRHSAFCRPR